MKNKIRSNPAKSSDAFFYHLLLICNRKIIS